jgi:hypothetical protein
MFVQFLISAHPLPIDSEADSRSVSFSEHTFDQSFVSESMNPNCSLGPLSVVSAPISRCGQEGGVGREGEGSGPIGGR